MKTFKIILVGDEKVGKSTFVQKLYDNTFKDSYTPTLGVNVVPIRIKTSAGDVCFNIWDCAGNDKYKGLGDQYYCGADAAIIMYDLTNLDTSRIPRAHDITKKTGTIPIVCVGNKVDELIGNDNEKIPLITQVFPHGALYRISCKTGYSLYQPLLELARQMFEKNNLQFIINFSACTDFAQTPASLGCAAERGTSLRGANSTSTVNLVLVEHETQELQKTEPKEYEYFCTKCQEAYKYDEQHFCEKIVMKKKEKQGFFSFSWLKFW